MKILYTTDLHGNHSKYRACFKAAVNHNVDMVINGGDMFPKREDLYLFQKEFINGFLRKEFKKYRMLATRIDETEFQQVQEFANELMGGNVSDFMLGIYYEWKKSYLKKKSRANGR